MFGPVDLIGSGGREPSPNRRKVRDVLDSKHAVAQDRSLSLGGSEPFLREARLEGAQGFEERREIVRDGDEGPVLGAPERSRVLRPRGPANVQERRRLRVNAEL